MIYVLLPLIRCVGDVSVEVGSRTKLFSEFVCGASVGSSNNELLNILLKTNEGTVAEYLSGV